MKKMQLTVRVTVDEDFQEYKNPEKKAFVALQGSMYGGSFIRDVEFVSAELVEVKEEES